jgi:hypothetical protein
VSSKLEMINCSSKNMTTRKNKDDNICIAMTTVSTKLGLEYVSFLIIKIPRNVKNIPILTLRKGDSN